MLREEHGKVTTFRKKLDTENYWLEEKLQEKADLLGKEKEKKNTLEDQPHQKVHKLKKEISCLKLEVGNYKAELPSTESYLGLVGANKPKKKQSQNHKRINANIDKSSSNENKGESTAAVLLHQNHGCCKCGSISPHSASQCTAKNKRC